MASPKLDSLNIRRFNETVNLYDDGKSQGTACEKTLASRVSGVSFNILSNKNTDNYFPNLRRGSQGNAFRKPYWQTKKSIHGPFKDSSQMAHSLLSPYEVVFDGSQLNVDSKFIPCMSTNATSHYPEKLMKVDELRMHVTCPSIWKNLSYAEDCGVSITEFELRKNHHTAKTQNLNCPQPLSSTKKGADRLHELNKNFNKNKLDSIHYPTISPRKDINRLSNYDEDLHLRSTASSISSNRSRGAIPRRLENSDFSVVRMNDHYGLNCKVTRDAESYARKIIGGTGSKGATGQSSVGYDVISNLRL